MPSEMQSGNVAVEMPAPDKLGANIGEGTPVVFRNLTYTVVSHHDKKQKITLLKNISGCFSPKQMSALMGPSGSGKTTLLDVLAGRKTIGEIDGEVLFSARPPSSNFLRRYTGYVEQFDTLLDILTVREMLMYTAELKRPTSESLEEKAAVVDRFIGKLALEACQNTRIGSALARGISGGQAKRTNIGIAMVVSPRVLFLDEPTSGLDSYTANEVMTAVKALVSDGVTICATIHSPTPYAFQLFDRLCLLVRGELVYHGPNDESMVAYFKGGCGVPPPHTALRQDVVSNSADFLTDLVVGADREGRAGEYAAAYADSDIKRAMDTIIHASAKQDTMRLDSKTVAELDVRKATATPLWWGLSTLIKYRTSRNYRNPEFLGPRIGDKLVFSLLIGTLYLGIGDNFSGDNLINTAAVLFMWCTLPAFGAASYVPALTLEKPLFVRERNDGLYRPITYLLSKVFDELCIALVTSLVFSVAVWFLVDLQGSYVVFWLVYLVTISCGITLAYVIAALAPNMDVANAALPAYVVTLLFFAGFLLRRPDMPAYWEWYSYINFLYYAFGALVINQFEGRDDDAFINGQSVLDYFGLEGKSKWAFIGYELLFFAAFFTAAWAVLQFKTIAKR